MWFLLLLVSSLSEMLAVVHGLPCVFSKLDSSWMICTDTHSVSSPSCVHFVPYRF